MKTTAEIKIQAIDEEKLRKSLSGHAYSFLKDGETFLSTKEKLVELNSNTDTPLEDEELDEIINTAESDRKSKKGRGKKEEENVIYTSFLETPEFILEQIVNASHATHATLAKDTKYIRYDKSTCLTSEEDNILYQGMEYRPIADELLEKGTVLLPSGVEEYGTEKELIEKMRKFLFSYFELPPFYEGFLPYLVFFYWVYDKFPFVPYLHFTGLTSTGKTTAQEVFGSICYKPIDVSGSITISPIFRTASTWGGTLLLDEFEPNGEGYGEMLALLKSGVGNKAVLRTEGDSKREVKVYLIKSPKIFTSEHPITNAGLQSRTIVVEMQKNKRRIPLYRLGGFLEEAQKIRNQMLLWRLRHLNKINLKEIEYGFTELQGFDRRVQQVITPIYYLSDEETKVQIAEFAEIQELETKKERQDSIEGQIFQSMVDTYPDRVTVKMIAIKLNEDQSSNRQISEKKVANIIRKTLTFKIKREGHENSSVILIKEKITRFNELLEYFGITSLSVARVANDASVAPEHELKNNQSSYVEEAEQTS